MSEACQGDADGHLGLRRVAVFDDGDRQGEKLVPEGPAVRTDFRIIQNFFFGSIIPAQLDSHGWIRVTHARLYMIDFPKKCMNLDTRPCCCSRRRVRKSGLSCAGHRLGFTASFLENR